MKVNVQERAERARQYFLEGYNCAQAVFLTYQDFTNLDPTTVATIAAPFGGGMGRLREVCGAFSGTVMMASFICPAVDRTDKKTKMENYALVQEFAPVSREIEHWKCAPSMKWKSTRNILIMVNPCR